MKQKRFSDEQIVTLFQAAEKGEKTIGALCKEHGIAEATFYRWRTRFGGMQVKEAQRLRDLEEENARLKRLLAERDLDIDLLKEALTKKRGGNQFALLRFKPVLLLFAF